MFEVHYLDIRKSNDDQSLDIYSQHLAAKILKVIWRWSEVIWGQITNIVGFKWNLVGSQHLVAKGHLEVVRGQTRNIVGFEWYI